MRFALGPVLALVLLVGCSGDDESLPTTSAPEIITIDELSGFAFTGGDVTDGGEIDPRHTCDGDNISPALTWENVPEGTQELVLVLEDPDAPGGTFTHWVVYAIPADYPGLDRGIPPGPVVSGAISLRQSPTDGSDVPGYFGPCPPEGQTHRYVFTLYALDEETALDGGASVDEVAEALRERAAASESAALTAFYGRP